MVGMFGALFLDKKTTASNHMVLKYYNLACSKVVEDFETPTLETIQVLVGLFLFSLCIYRYKLLIPRKAYLFSLKIDLGKINRSMMYLKLVSQMAIYLELNVDPDKLERLKHENWVKKEIHRRFWFIVNYVEKSNFIFRNIYRLIIIT